MFNFKSKNTCLTNATVAVTFKCNAKCLMCNIWKDNIKDELLPDDFLKLPKTLRDINITGGEPFLRKDIVEIVKKIVSRNPKARLIFSSNGLLTDKIVDSMKEIVKINPKSGIAISIDGIGNIHSEIRGIENAFEKSIKTVEELQKANINDIRLAFTASNNNINQLSDVYRLASNLNVEFTMSIVHNSENYFDINTNLQPDYRLLESQVNSIINEELKFNNPRRLFRVYYLKGILEFAKTSKRILPCYALENSFFLDAKGDIFLCNILQTSVGNIKEHDFETIWSSPKIEKLKKVCNKCNKCWMVCTVKGSIIKHPFKVGQEVLKDKLKNVMLMF
jgi:MoaA/NifB/PqqE/SkfB family radical SAM enzyme